MLENEAARVFSKAFFDGETYLFKIWSQIVPKFARVITAVGQDAQSADYIEKAFTHVGKSGVCPCMISMIFINFDSEGK